MGIIKKISQHFFAARDAGNIAPTPSQSHRPHDGLPERVRAVASSYDPASGCYRNEDGTLDPCHTEIETLETWNAFLKCVKPKTVVETGVYYGLSTCYIAAALRSNRIAGAKVHSIDPWDLEHYWQDSDLEDYVQFYKMSTQEAVQHISHLEIDVLIIDSIHTYDQSSWELQALEPQVKEGGYIIMHDTLYYDGVGRTVKHLYDSPRFEVITFETPRTSKADTVDQPVPMGCTIARKIRNGTPIEREDAWIPVPESAPAGPQPFLRLDAMAKSGD